MKKKGNDVVFSESVKKAQRVRQTRKSIEEHFERNPMKSELDDSLLQFIAQRDSFYFASASTAGLPSIQHRGGPPGFLVALSRELLAFADYSGNRQYITVGNLEENSQVSLFLMDYAQRRRLKIWGRARTIEDLDNSPLTREQTNEIVKRADTGNIERIIVIQIDAWDLNCPKHITPRLTVSEWEQSRRGQ